MNNSKIIDVEELKGKIGAFTQYLMRKNQILQSKDIEEMLKDL